MKLGSLPFLIGSLFVVPDTVSVVLVGVVAPKNISLLVECEPLGQLPHSSPGGWGDV